jgi:hypothetical protein
MTKSRLALVLSISIVACSSQGTPSNSGEDNGGSNGDQGGSGGKTNGGSGGKINGGSGGKGQGGSSVGGSGPGQGGSGDGGSGPGEGGSGPGQGGSDQGQGGSGQGGAGDGGSGDGGSVGSGGSGAGGTVVPPSSFTALTNRYDNGRSGWNSKETILNTTNIAQAGKFGLVFSRTIQGVSYSQPLYVPGLTIKGAKHNVVFVATEHNMLYAFDADDPAASAPLWSKMFAAPFPVPAAGLGCQDMHDEVGITSTPTIDLAANKLYLISKTGGSSLLHAIDITTGDDAMPPATIMGGGFNSNIHLNRPGLLLQGGVVYIGFGSHCDKNAWHGWVFGYDAKTLTQTGIYNVTPGGGGGAVWQSGTGLAGDDQGVYLCTGNGDFAGASTSLSVLRLKLGTLQMADRYTPGNAGGLNGSDKDLTAGVVFIGDTGYMVSGGKEGVIYLFKRSDIKNIAQTLNPAGGEIHDFAYYNGPAGQLIYLWPDGGMLTAYKFDAGMLTLQKANTITPEGYQGGHPGGIFTVSSNGTTAGSGIVWSTVSYGPGSNAWHGTATGELIAFDANDVSQAPLWRSGRGATGPDKLGTLAKFSPPLVANGKVYVATFSGKLQVYGLK